MDKNDRDLSTMICAGSKEQPTQILTKLGFLVNKISFSKGLEAWICILYRKVSASWPGSLPNT